MPNDSRLPLSASRNLPGDLFWSRHALRKLPKVRDAIRVVEQDGWRLARTRGSHRQFKHPHKPGLVTIAGKMSKDLAPATWDSIRKQAGLDERQSP